jgi:hypothetical protein
VFLPREPATEALFDWFASMEFSLPSYMYS